MELLTIQGTPLKYLAITISSLHVVSCALTNIYFCYLSHTSFLMSLCMVGCAATSVAATSAQGCYMAMVNSEAHAVDSSSTIKPESQETVGYFKRILIRFVTPITVLSGVVYASLSCVSAYTIMLACCGSPLLAIVLGLFSFANTLVLSYYFGGESLQPAFVKVGEMFDGDLQLDSLSFNGVVVYISLCGLTSLPLLSTCLYSLIQTALIFLGLPASIVSPFTLVLCVPLLVAVAFNIVSVCYSQGSKSLDYLIGLYTTFKNLVEVREKIYFGVGFIFAVMISLVTIVLGVVGDLAGLSSVLQIDLGVGLTIVVATMSAAANLAFTFADTVKAVTLMVKSMLDLCIKALTNQNNDETLKEIPNQENSMSKYSCGIFSSHQTKKPLEPVVLVGQDLVPTMDKI